MYVYISSEPQTPLWTVGHYAPDGKFIPESDHGTEAEAAARVHYLNGGEHENANPSREDAVDRRDLKDERERLIAALAGLTVMGHTDDWNIVVGPVGWGNAQAVLDDVTGRERKQEPEPQEGMTRVEFDCHRMYVEARKPNEQYAISRYTAAAGWQIVARFASRDEADRYARELAT